MILVLLGTQNYSFKRLLEKIQEMIDKKVINDKVVVQAGRTKFESKDMEILGMVSDRKFKKLIKEADLIITHGGVGSIVTSLKMNKKVIAVPRLSGFDEHINDHQIQIVDTFNKQGLLIGVIELTEFEDALKRVKDFEPAKFISQTDNMINLIENFIDNN